MTRLQKSGKLKKLSRDVVENARRTKTDKPTVLDQNKTPQPPEWLLRMAPEDINMWPEIWQSDEVDRANRMNALRESLRNQVRRRERQLEANHANSSPQSIRVRRQVYRQQRKYDMTQGTETNDDFVSDLTNYR